MTREVKQTATDGSTRTFYFFRCVNDKPWLTICERDPSGKSISTTDINFQGDDLQKFIAAAQAIV